MKRPNFSNTIRIGYLSAVTGLAFTLCTSISSAAPALVAGSQESFEGAGLGYNLNPVGGFGAGGVQDYFEVVPNDGTRISPLSGIPGNILAGDDGSNMLAGTDTDSVGGISTGVSVTFNSVGIAGLTNISARMLLGSSIGNGGTGGLEATDFLQVLVSTDGGAFTPVIVYQPDESVNGGTNTYLSHDTDINGDGDDGSGSQAGSAAGSPQGIETSFNEYIIPIPTGSTTQVRVTLEAGGSHELLAIDNFRIFGEVAVTDPPVLGGVPGTALDYDEGDPATLVVPALTVTDTDSAQLTGATVQITSNNTLSEDVLAATGGSGVTVQPYVAGTGTLTFTGTASLAAYQAALRSVTYQNTNATNPNTNPRTVTFLVTDDQSNSSGPAIRTINVTNGILTHAIPHTESFDDGLGTGDRYNVVGGFDVGTNDFFSRLPAADASGARFATAITGVVGGGFFGGEDIDQNGEADGGKVVLCLDATGLGNLEVNVLLAAAASGFELTDGLWVEYQFDGGLWQELIAFRPASFGGHLSEDTDADDLGDGTALTTTLTSYILPILDTGSVLKVRVRALTSSTSEEIAFDELIVTGSIGGAPPVLASIEVTTINYTEGDGATQITNTITVADADSVSLESATIQISANNVPGEDELATVGVPAGITVVPFVPATGTLELTGTASLVDYQTALRSVTYVNNNLVNPDQNPRTVTFRVNDGALNSNTQDRTIEVLDLVGIQTAPHCESFETEGLGTRYAANAFDLAPDFFGRAATNFGGLTGGNADGSFAFGGKDTGADGDSVHSIDIAIDTSGLSNLQLDLKLAAVANQFETSDTILIEADSDGGGFVRLTSFHPNGINTSLSEDTDNNGVGDGVTFLGPDFTDHNFDLPEANLTRIRITMNTTASTEEVAVDNICVMGTDAEPPVADLADPLDGSSLAASAINAQGYIDVTFTDVDSGINHASITDAASEFTISGLGAGTAVFNGTPVLQSGTTYRYSFAGSFDPGTVSVEFIAASFADLDGNENLAETEGFTLLLLDSLSQWQTDNFDPGDLADPAKESTVWGSGADPDGDCIHNIYEFLHGLDPNAFDELPPVTQSTTGATFATVSFKKRIDLSGTSLDVQVSSSRAAGFVSVVKAPSAAPSDPGFEIITYEDDVAVAAGAPRFIKLVMTEGVVDYSSETLGTTCLAVKPHNVATPGTLSFMGLQFVKPKAANGIVTGTGAGTLTDSSANWPIDAFLDHYVRITSGVDEGAMADIALNTATELTLLDDLSGLVIVGESYEIRPHTTIGCVFGELNEAGLSGGINSTDADNIVLVNASGMEQTIFYDTVSSQWTDINGFVDATEQVIHPEQGFVIRRKLAAALNIYPQGSILIGKKAVRIAPGFNLVGTIKTNDALTLDALGLYTGDTGTGVVAGPNPLDADNLLITNPDGSTSLYFYLDFSGTLGWVDSSYTPSGGVTVEPGSSFFIRRRPPNPEFSWTIPAE